MPSVYTIQYATPLCFARRMVRNGQHGVHFTCFRPLRYCALTNEWQCGACDGLIAGEWIAKKDAPPVNAVSRYQDEHGDEQQEVVSLEMISGMAPECRLISLKVLDENGIGNASNLIAAIAHVQEINGYGRRILIHGINISIGYDFDPKWFACGQSPLCVEVDRLVKSGVVVVVAAGNTGYGAVNNGSSSAGLTVTINDPGNAELAITVGATHRDMPHTYGVSYFSSKGPTGDGRPKPDLLAPGERILSCQSSGVETACRCFCDRCR